MQVGRMCRRRVDLAMEDEPVLAIARRMNLRNVGTVIVVDAARHPVGIATDRDLVTRVMAAGRDPSSTLLGDVMTREPRVVSEDSDVEAAISVMKTGSFRRVPVVDATGALIGILSLDDAIRTLGETLSRVGAILSDQTPDRAALD